MLSGLRHRNRTRLAACDLQQQLRRPLHGTRLLRRIDAALETLTGIGGQSPAQGASNDGVRSKVSRFEKDVLGLSAYGRALASHDTRNSDGSGRVSNQQNRSEERRV